MAIPPSLDCPMNRLSQFTAAALIALSGAASAATAPHWVASWQASPQPVWARISSNPGSGRAA